MYILIYFITAAMRRWLRDKIKSLIQKGSCYLVEITRIAKCSATVGAFQRLVSGVGSNVNLKAVSPRIKSATKAALISLTVSSIVWGVGTDKEI